MQFKSMDVLCLMAITGSLAIAVPNLASGRSEASGHIASRSLEGKSRATYENTNGPSPLDEFKRDVTEDGDDPSPLYEFKRDVTEDGDDPSPLYEFKRSARGGELED